MHPDVRRDLVLLGQLDQVHRWLVSTLDGPRLCESAGAVAKLGPLVQLVSKQNRRRNKVKRQRRFGTEVEAASIAAAQIETLIDSLRRCQQSLDCDIATEEERTRCSDDSDPAYSVFARSLIPRRDNVAATIAILQARLSKTELPTSTGIGSVPVQLLQPA